MRMALAFRVFFKALFDAEFAARVAPLLQVAREDEQPAAHQPTVKKPAKKKPVRSEAVTLLATLQREARFVDMVQEPLDNYNDAQVGAAARDVLRDCGQVLKRLFDLKPLMEQQEGHEVEVPVGFDAGCIRLTGNVSGAPPFHGRLVHHGWLATRCEVPQWTGSERSQMVVAPEEVELA